MTAVHETFHLFGLGDRYTDASYIKIFNNGKIDYTHGQSVSHVGWDGDIMSVGDNGNIRSVGDNSTFSQIHIDNFLEKALKISEEKKQHKFSMGRKVDKANNRDLSAIPETKPLTDITVNKEVGKMVNPIYLEAGKYDPRKL